VTPDWLRDSVARGRPLPCADYAALPDLRERDEKFSPRSTSESRITSHYSSPPTRSQSPPRAASSTDGIIPPPAYLLPPPAPPPAVKLEHTAHFCCARASPLVCPNQPLCDALDVLKRGRALESNERSALSYSRAIAVSLHDSAQLALSTCRLGRPSKVLIYACISCSAYVR
jgi:DNA polymerase IV